ncbi:MAG: PmoA family protein [Bryobacteraceae bacterium]
MKSIILSLLLVLPAFADVKVARDKDHITVEINGKPFTAFYFGPETTKPYLHPLRSASGKIVTRQFPMENVEGETRDHPHHQGLWFTHGDVNGIDFWSGAAGRSPKKGKVVLDRIVSTKSGKDQGSITARFNWVGPDGKVVLTETREMIFRADPQNRVIDFDITLKANDSVKFGDTKEGTFAIRLADVLNEKHTGTMVNAEGAQKMENVWGKASPWVDYVGELDGEKLGIAIMDHPGNPGHPTYWHSRDYGLFAANIFGHHDFLDDKTKDGSRTLKPGETMRFRYRVLIHPGDTKAADLSKLYSQYAHGTS